jgi:hypothetical protein
MKAPPRPTEPLSLAASPQAPEVKAGKTFGTACSPDVLEGYRTTLHPSVFKLVTGIAVPEGIPPDQALEQMMSERRARLELKRLRFQTKLQEWSQRAVSPVTPTTEAEQGLSKEFEPWVLDFLRVILHPESVEELVKLKATRPEKAPSHQELMSEMIKMLASSP